MGKFDGMLLLSDWDGTLFHNGEVSIQNKEAIEYFMREGGYFTICSGRNIAFLKEQCSKICPNTYSVALNGAYIANTENGEILYRDLCGIEIHEFIKRIFETGSEYFQVSLHYDGADSSLIVSKDTYLNNFDEFKRLRLYKALLYAVTPELGDTGVIRANSILSSEYTGVRSWRSSLEIFKKSNDKGSAIKRLASHLGVKLTIAVGDYENDISMLKSADIGYAVGNAVSELKAVADRITVSCVQSALAQIIKDLENLTL